MHRPRQPFIESLERRQLLNGTITGTVWDDLNGNGVRESNEPGLAGQRVYLDQNFNGTFDGSDISVTTNVNGKYTFSDVPTGIRRVQYDLVQGRRLTGPANVFYDVTITFDNTVANRNFASTDTCVVRGRVFTDLNNDARFQTGESGLSGWRVFIDKNNNGVWDPATEKSRITNSNGDYRFTGLPVGTYIIRIEQQEEFVRTVPLSGAWRVTFTTPAQSISNRHFGERAIEKGEDGPRT